MGKTKTSFVASAPEEKKSSEELYREKKLRQEAAKKAAEGKSEVHIAGLKGGQRVKVVEAEPTPETQTEEAKKEEKNKKNEPKVRGKKYVEMKAKFAHDKLFPLKEALKLVKETSYSAFDGTVELHLVVKKTGLSASVTLPHSTGKEKKVEIADEKTIEKLKAGKIDFDILVATTEMMPKLVPFARILGPKGLMPNPKNGTLVPDLKKAKSVNVNAKTVKTEKEAPLIHTTIGKVSQKDEELMDNLNAIIKAVSEKQIVKGYLKATMGPSVKIKI